MTYETLLANNQFRDFFISYEQRYIQCHHLGKQRAEQTGPQWTGNPIDTLHIWCEQGFGDCLQFLRFLKFIPAKEIIVTSYPELARLIEMQPSVHSIRLQSPPKQFDAQCSLLSIPYWLGLEAIDSKPVLTVPPPAKFASTKRKIAICWAGNAIQGGDANRSIPLASFAPLFAMDVEVYSFVVDRRKRVYMSDEREEIDLAAHPEEWKIMDVSCHIRDWHDTAALLGGMDMLITVDTGLAHLAGAMGKKTILLLSSNPEWRWMTIWYDSVTYVKQEPNEEWQHVVQRAICQLNHNYQ